MPYRGEAHQKWVLQQNRLVNRTLPTDCIGLKKTLFYVSDEADVIMSPYEGKSYQHWRIEYVLDCFVDLLR